MKNEKKIGSETKVSIALATYNGGKYLREQLDSIYNQTHKDIEVIVSDDCSKDSTISILEEYKSKYGLQYFVNEKNLGFVRNFERAISLCTGDFIALADQDDIWIKNKIEFLVEKIAGNNLIFADATIIDDNGTLIEESFMNSNMLQYSSENQFERLLYRNFVQGASMLFRSTLREKILPFPDEIPYHDWWIALVASAYGNIKFENKKLIEYRLHEANHTATLGHIHSKMKYYCQNDEGLKMIRMNFENFIKATSRKFSQIEFSTRITKAKKFINLTSRNLNKFYRFVSLVGFFLTNKYIFKPKLSYMSYLWYLTKYFLVSNSLTKYFYNLKSRKLLL